MAEGIVEAHPRYEQEKVRAPGDNVRDDVSIVTEDGIVVNASGHKDELQRQYGLLSLCGLAFTVDNAWVAMGGSLSIAIFNGGPPGVLYELLTAIFYYSFIGASIAELASAVPSSGGVYHWASVTPGPKAGRFLGFFAGSINFFGWMFDLAAIVQITSNAAVQLYAVWHPDLEVKPWMVYVAYLLLTWLGCAVVVFFNKALPTLQHLGTFMVVVGGFVTIVVIAAMPKQHSSNSFVWRDWDNQTGWPSGVAFLTGVLNGAFTIGTVDAISHVAEELPLPKKDLPRGVAAQLGLGGLSAFLFAITIFYGVTDWPAILDSGSAFPLAAIYLQATGSQAATFGLLLILFLSLCICIIGTFVTLGRIWWSLARDNATPFASVFSMVNVKLSCPIPATVFCAVIATGLGAIPLGSPTAFTDLAGSFIVLTTTSYALAIGPHMLTGRKNIPKGPFWMGKAGATVNVLAVLLIILFDILFCFPYALPTTTQTMNYNSVILAGIVALTVGWWFIHGWRKYPGPKLQHLYLDGHHVITKEA